ncbi:MAG: imidazole glycerol phosphate synthase subunit HisH [Polyangiaceae bacterium]
MSSSASHAITIVDCGTGNLHSLQRQLRNSHADTTVTKDPASVRSATKLVLPGVGHFGTAMERMRATGMVEAIREAVLERGVPVLGVCLGMQLMARKSAEGDCEGLGLVDAEVVRFSVKDSLRYKVPHVGWNRIRVRRQSRLFDGIAEDAEFYFVHSFHFAAVDEAIAVGDSRYDYEFTSAIEHGNIFGIQAHPEKSHDAGSKLLENFVGL